MSDYSSVDFESSDEYYHLKNFVHRTFNGNDCLFFLSSLKIFTKTTEVWNRFSPRVIKPAEQFSLHYNIFRQVFLEIPHDNHVRKHLSDVTANASAKRLNMYLRWMVRADENDVDFGLWKTSPIGINASSRCAYR